MAISPSEFSDDKEKQELYRIAQERLTEHLASYNAKLTGSIFENSAPFDPTRHVDRVRDHAHEKISTILKGASQAVDSIREERMRFALRDYIRQQITNDEGKKNPLLNFISKGAQRMYGAKDIREEKVLDSLVDKEFPGRDMADKRTKLNDEFRKLHNITVNITPLTGAPTVIDFNVRFRIGGPPVIDIDWKNESLSSIEKKLHQITHTPINATARSLYLFLSSQADYTKYKKLREKWDIFRQIENEAVTALYKEKIYDSDRLRNTFNTLPDSIKNIISAHINVDTLTQDPSFLAMMSVIEERWNVYKNSTTSEDDMKKFLVDQVGLTGSKELDDISVLTDLNNKLETSIVEIRNLTRNQDIQTRLDALIKHTSPRQTPLNEIDEALNKKDDLEIQYVRATKPDQRAAVQSQITEIKNQIKALEIEKASIENHILLIIDLAKGLAEIYHHYSSATPPDLGLGRLPNEIKNKITDLSDFVTNVSGLTLLGFNHANFQGIVDKIRKLKPQAQAFKDYIEKEKTESKAQVWTVEKLGFVLTKEKIKDEQGITRDDKALIGATTLSWNLLKSDIRHRYEAGTNTELCELLVKRAGWKKWAATTFLRNGTTFDYQEIMRRIAARKELKPYREKIAALPTTTSFKDIKELGIPCQYIPRMIDELGQMLRGFEGDGGERIEVKEEDALYLERLIDNLRILSAHYQTEQTMNKLEADLKKPENQGKKVDVNQLTLNALEEISSTQVEAEKSFLEKLGEKAQDAFGTFKSLFSRKDLKAMKKGELSDKASFLDFDSITSTFGKALAFKEIADITRKIFGNRVMQFIASPFKKAGKAIRRKMYQKIGGVETWAGRKTQAGASALWGATQWGITAPFKAVGWSMFLPLRGIGWTGSKVLWPVILKPIQAAGAILRSSWNLYQPSGTVSK